MISFITPLKSHCVDTDLRTFSWDLQHTKVDLVVSKIKWIEIDFSWFCVCYHEKKYLMKILWLYEPVIEKFCHKPISSKIEKKN